MVSPTIWPRLSIVTPSFNQARFLEATIQSVLNQNYPNLEYSVMDGGSTDGSVDIIHRYESQLTHWVSEPDAGQTDAINKGFAASTGEIMAWLNSDDLYLPWTFKIVADIFRQLPEVKWLTTTTSLACNDQGLVTAAVHHPGFARTWFYRGWHLGSRPGFKGHIQQEATFWRRELWDAAGGKLDPQLHYGGDFELWARFWQQADLATTTVPLANFRYHPNQKTAQIERYYAECEDVLRRYRSKTIHSPFLIRVASSLLRVFGRGGRRFGSQLNRADYDPQRAVWRNHASYTI